ncbi:SpoIIE family protein phosphatase [Cellulomonas palmilytica]|uniref:SpoIIE family protein phosphatase n=1 Tax=Cellulomonas palmilytica TaxID=2608402 RepID=UPI001F2E7CFD|nr:SpoIIE family protein phosphatase [Cellulomonas palmilytica]UJP39622.1 SpoIIE family protein phosphatase [Cellulomonas palmilytica]
MTDRLDPDLVGSEPAASDDVTGSIGAVGRGAQVERALAALTQQYEADRLRWQLAVTAGGVGSFDWDLRTGRLDWDDQLLAVFGLDRAQFSGAIEAFYEHVVADDHARVAEALEAALETCGQYEAEYRVLRGDGAVRWVKARGVALAGPDGRATRLLGAAYDTTSERDAEARMDRVLETMPGAFFLLDDEWRFRYVNSSGERMLGFPRDELVGGTLWELFPFVVGTEVEDSYRGAVRDGHPRMFEVRSSRDPDLWYEVRAWPGPDGLSVYFDDISERRHALDEARAARELEQASSRRLALLSEVGDHLSSTLETEEAVRRLARHLVPTFGSWCLVTMSEDQRHLRDIAAWHEDPTRRATVTRYASLRIDSLAPDAYLFRTLRTGEPVVVPDATESITRVLTGGARDVLRDLAPRTAYAVPMRSRGRTVGAITIFLDEGWPDLGTEDLALLVQLADRAGLALENARLYERQREIAVALQRSLLSAPAQSEDLDVVVRYVAAAEAAQVGGDWYDAFVQPSGHTVVAIGDVMGHDTPAAAAMSQLRTLLRGIAHTTSGTPAEVLTALESASSALRIDAMATAVVARFETSDEDPGLTTVRWTNAGHLPPILVRPDGSVSLLEAERAELVLGLDPGTTRTDRTTSVPRGTTLLLYTDGLVERRGEHLRRGLTRLVDEVTRLVSLARTSGPAGALDLERLVDDLLGRMTAGPPDDDIAVLAVQLRPLAG